MGITSSNVYWVIQCSKWFKVWKFPIIMGINFYYDLKNTFEWVCKFDLCWKGYQACSYNNILFLGFKWFRSEKIAYLVHFSSSRTLSIKLCVVLSRCMWLENPLRIPQAPPEHFSKLITTIVYSSQVPRGPKWTPNEGHMHPYHFTVWSYISSSNHWIFSYDILKWPSTLINVVGKRNLNGINVYLRWRSERDTLDQR